jgi:orotate phosphoribosyltransferase-like protein
MERSAAIAMLSTTHARILELDERGLTRGEIANELDIDPVSVGPLLAVAKAKLETLEAQPRRKGGTT